MDETKGPPEAVIQETRANTYPLPQKSRTRRAIIASAREENSTDYLTGLASQKYFGQELIRSINIALRDPNPEMGMQILDIDDYGQFNKRYGHSKGDEVLGDVGLAVKTSIRRGDLAGKMGGDEIGVIMQYGEQGAPKEENRSERIREAIAQIPSEGMENPVTVSIGTTDFYPGDDYKTFKDRAEAALRLAKLLGKNRTVFSRKEDSRNVYVDLSNGSEYFLSIDGANEITEIENSQTGEKSNVVFIDNKPKLVKAA